MKLLALLSAAAMAAGTIVATPAAAQYYGHGYHHGYHRHGGYRYRPVCRVHRGYRHLVRRCY